jgi:hypothetical protein
MQKKLVLVIILSISLFLSVLNISSIAATNNESIKTTSFFAKLKQGIVNIFDSFLALFGRNIQLSPEGNTITEFILNTQTDPSRFVVSVADSASQQEIDAAQAFVDKFGIYGVAKQSEAEFIANRIIIGTPENLPSDIIESFDFTGALTKARFQLTPYADGSLIITGGTPQTILDAVNTFISYWDNSSLRAALNQESILFLDGEFYKDYQIICFGDSDGENIFEKGYVTLNESDSSYDAYDECEDSGAVIEYECINSTLYIGFYDCANGCSDGACIPTEEENLPAIWVNSPTNAIFVDTAIINDSWRQIVYKWEPNIEWGNAIMCKYSYDNTSWFDADCQEMGRDISAPNEGTQRLYIQAIDANDSVGHAESELFWMSNLPEDIYCPSGYPSGCRSIRGMVAEAGLDLNNVARVDLLILRRYDGGGNSYVIKCPSNYSNFNYDWCVQNENDGVGNHVLLGVKAIIPPSEKIDCYWNFDCGKLNIERRCSDGIILRKATTGICNNPGTPQSYCSLREVNTSFNCTSGMCANSTNCLSS